MELSTVVVVLFLAESIKLQIVDKSLKSRHFQILPRIAQESINNCMLIYTAVLCNIVFETGSIEKHILCRS